MLCFTWNVGNAEPIESELAHWLPANGGDFDIIAVGTQENRYKEHRQSSRSRASSSRQAGSDEDDSDEDEPVSVPVPGGASVQAPAQCAAKDNAKGDASKDAPMGPWEGMVMRRLGSEAWRLCKLITLREMHLAVFVRSVHFQGDAPLLRNVQAARSATGIGGVVGNKGGLVVALTFGAMRLCFASCHLAAHSHRLAARNANCAEILRETRHTIGTQQLDISSEFGARLARIPHRPARALFAPDSTRACERRPPLLDGRP